MDKAYEPGKHEAKIYELWEKSGAFKPDLKAKKTPFSIIMPPPNANGSLHLGHAMYVIEDILTRYRRMAGHPTLWLPGADHAGIETQVVYEKELAKQGRDRFDLGPEKFYAEVMDFTLKNKANMIAQLKSLGFSADWSRLKFTLDDDIIAIVYDTFKKLHADGLIYRGPRIVNWCTACQSSFADIEIKYRTQKDELYTLDYGPVQIATTRPETIFADVAVAVNPRDRRYQSLIGKNALVPLADRPIPVIADAYVDAKFGTGALKITPAHDPNDYQIGQEHNLPEISVINLEGKMENVPEALLGLTVKQARAKTIELLKKAGKLVKTTPLSHSVGYHDRCGTMIEPLVTEQWWLKVEPLVAPAIKAVQTGQIQIIPMHFEKNYINWLVGLRDWNISRQNWWGIRIPVFYSTGHDSKKEPYIIGTEADAKKHYGAGHYRAETDTFDTWFSSGQWPFATLMATNAMDFYPTSVMETGRDILFLWVTRMVMIGIYRTGKVPFKTIYLHGLVRDAKGQKMSKSKGNVIDPLDVTAEYGTDALRLALTIGITPGQDGSLSEEKIQGYRNFCNKLWNASRFVLDKAKNYSPTPAKPTTLADKWIAHRLSETVVGVTKDLENFRFSEAGQQVYSLLWNDFADWYLEASKTELNLPLLVHGLETILKLAHPFAPFVTEAIWQNMAWQKQNLIISSWPEPGSRSSVEAQEFETLRGLVTQIRNLQHKLQLPKLHLVHAEKLIQNNELLIKSLARVEKFETGERGQGLALMGVKAWLDADAKVIDRYRHHLQEELKLQQGRAGKLEKQLKNAGFMKSAKPEVKAQTKAYLAEAEDLIRKMDAEIKAIKPSR